MAESPDSGHHQLLSGEVDFDREVLTLRRLTAGWQRVRGPIFAMFSSL
jgi:hypothetical protein